MVRLGGICCCCDCSYNDVDYTLVSGSISSGLLTSTDGVITWFDPCYTYKRAAARCNYLMTNGKDPGNALIRIVQEAAAGYDEIAFDIRRYGAGRPLLMRVLQGGSVLASTYTWGETFFPDPSQNFFATNISQPDGSGKVWALWAEGLGIYVDDLDFVPNGKVRFEWEDMDGPDALRLVGRCDMAINSSECGDSYARDDFLNVPSFIWLTASGFTDGTCSGIATNYLNTTKFGYTLGTSGTPGIVGRIWTVNLEMPLSYCSDAPRNEGYAIYLEEIGTSGDWRLRLEFSIEWITSGDVDTFTAYSGVLGSDVYDLFSVFASGISFTVDAGSIDIQSGKFGMGTMSIDIVTAVSGL